MSSTSTALRISLHTQLHLKMVKSNKPRFVSSEDGGRYPGNGMLNSGSSKTSIPDVVTHDLQSLNLHGGGDDCSVKQSVWVMSLAILLSVSDLLGTQETNS